MDEAWKQLGLAVVTTTIADYVALLRKLDKEKDKPYSHARQLTIRTIKDQIDYLQRVFESQYFGAICPKYDTSLLPGLLAEQYKTLNTKVVHQAQMPGENKKAVIYTEPPRKRGRPRKYESEWSRY